MASDVFFRVQHRLNDLHRSARAVSLAAGMSPDAIRDLGRPKRGKLTSPTIETIEKLAHALDVTPEWLAFGAGDPAARRDLYILGDVAAGVWLEADADRSEPARHLVAPDPRFPVDAQYLLRAQGTSMNAVIAHDDLIHCVDFVKAGLRPKPNDIVVVERHRVSGEREVTAKRLIERDGRMFLAAESLDPKWAGYFVAEDVDDGESVVVTALIIRAIREFR